MRHDNEKGEYDLMKPIELAKFEEFNFLSALKR